MAEQRGDWRKLPPWNPFRLVWAVFDLWLPERKDKAPGDERKTDG